MSASLFVLIVGSGRLGSYLANGLSRAGHGVVAIDSDESAFQDLTAEFSGFRIEGDATEIAVLRQARIERADLVLATTRDDGVNMMVAQIASKVFSVPRVIARLFDPKREVVYGRLGIETICPTTLAAELFLDSIADHLAKRTAS